MKSKDRQILTLNEMVSRYGVDFSIEPGAAAAVSGRIAQMTCRLELNGRHRNRDKCNGASCPACIQVLQSLFEIADALRSVERETLSRLGGACETRAHYASASGTCHKVTLGFELTLRPPLQATSDSWAWIFIERVRTALVDLGCRNLAPAEPVGCRPRFPVPRAERLEMVHQALDEADDKRCLTA